MKTNARFIKSITKAAAKNDTVMPWARGSRRAAFIAKRNAAEAAPQRKVASTTTLTEILPDSAPPPPS